MGYLTVNSLEPSPAVDSVSESIREVGQLSPAFDGSMRRTRLATKRDVSFTTVPQLQATAYAWECLFRGLGEAWSFESSLYGSKGLGPSASTAAAVSATRAKFGTQSLKLTATTGTITYTANTGTNYSLLFFFWNGSAWDHYCYVTGGTVYKNGTAGGGTPTGLTVTPSATTMVLAEAGGSDKFIDDLVILPYVVLSTWPATLDDATVAFSSLPQLTLAGDGVAEASSRTVVGEVEGSKVVSVHSGGTLYRYRSMSVTLSEA